MRTDSHRSEEIRETIAEYLKHSLKPRAGYTIVQLQLPKNLHDSISTYLSSAGLEDSEGITKIVEFGLGLSSDAEFAMIDVEIRLLKARLGEADIKLGSKKLDAYENIMENKALAVELASLLSDNRLLHQRLEVNNLIDKHWTGRQHEDKVRKVELFLSKYTFRPRL
jgi:hypothetical protein